jgi:hypothetical protein
VPAATAPLPPAPSGPSPLPPLRAATGESRSRQGARDLLSRLHDQGSVFALRCSRCASRNAVCWGSASGALSLKCGECVRTGKPCDLQRDQVSEPLRLAGCSTNANRFN